MGRFLPIVCWWFVVISHGYYELSKGTHWNGGFKWGFDHWHSDIIIKTTEPTIHGDSVLPSMIGYLSNEQWISQQQMGVSTQRSWGYLLVMGLWQEIGLWSGKPEISFADLKWFSSKIEVYQINSNHIPRFIWVERNDDEHWIWGHPLFARSHAVLSCDLWKTLNVCWDGSDWCLDLIIFNLGPSPDRNWIKWNHQMHQMIWLKRFFPQKITEILHAWPKIISNPQEREKSMKFLPSLSRLPIPESWSDFRRWVTPTRNSRLALPLATTGPEGFVLVLSVHYIRLCKLQGQGHHAMFYVLERCM